VCRAKWCGVSQQTEPIEADMRFWLSSIKSGYKKDWQNIKNTTLIIKVLMWENTVVSLKHHLN
jgi:ferric iron reductase protein FhuF